MELSLDYMTNSVLFESCCVCVCVIFHFCRTNWLEFFKSLISILPNAVAIGATHYQHSLMFRPGKCYKKKMDFSSSNMVFGPLTFTMHTYQVFFLPFFLFIFISISGVSLTTSWHVGLFARKCLIAFSMVGLISLIEERQSNNNVMCTQYSFLFVCMPRMFSFHTFHAFWIPRT